MITLTAKIGLNLGGSGTLSGVTSNLLGNNISSDIGKVLGSKSKGGNPFLLGVTKFRENAHFSDGEDYFISKQVSNAEGNFDERFEIDITGENIDGFTIKFDTYNNRHPKSIVVDGVKYYDDDATYNITSLESSNSHKIIIDNWSDAGYPLVITSIAVGVGGIEVDYRNLISLNRSIFYRGDNKFPSYGIISNTGNLEFNDLDGEVRDYAEQMLLTSDLKVEITLNNTLTKTKEKVAVFETRDWDYDNDNRSVSVSLKDDLEEWQDIQVQGFSHDPRNPFSVISDGKMSNLYIWLQGKDEKGNYRTPKKYKMFSFAELDEKTQDILDTTIVQYPLLENGTLWQQWQKVCEVCGLYIYKNNEGRTVCTYTYGS